MDWLTKLRAWNYPYAERLAPVLESLGFNPEQYASHFDLARDLRTFEARQRAIGISIPPEIMEFFKWIIEKFKEFVEKNLPAISLMAGGGVATIFLPRAYKIVGIVPIVAGIYWMLKNYGVV